MVDRAEMQREYDQRNQELEQAERELANISQQVAAANAEVSAAMQEQSQMEGNFMNIQRRVRDITREIEQAQRQRQNRMATFDSDTPRLLDLIHRTRFTRTPVGPLALVCDIEQGWERAFEHACSFTKNAMITATFADRSALEKAAKQAKIRHDMVIAMDKVENSFSLFSFTFSLINLINQRLFRVGYTPCFKSSKTHHLQLSMRLLICVTLIVL